MAIPKSLKKLTDVFRSAGARHPELWAKSQIDQGINQLHRYLFLRQAWKCVISEADPSWIANEKQRAAEDSEAPFAGVGQALERLQSAGAATEDLITLVRGMQAQLLFNLCYLLDDPAIDDKGLSEVGWTLVETDSDLEPTGRTIGGLHESVLETDPSGREMRPRRYAETLVQKRTRP